MYVAFEMWMEPKSWSCISPQVGGSHASGSGRARRESATRAMQGWHSQRLLGNGEITDPVIKVFVAFKSRVTSDLHFVV